MKFKGTLEMFEDWTNGEIYLWAIGLAFCCVIMYFVTKD